MANDEVDAPLDAPGGRSVPLAADAFEAPDATTPASPIRPPSSTSDTRTKHTHTHTSHLKAQERCVRDAGAAAAGGSTKCTCGRADGGDAVVAGGAAVDAGGSGGRADKDDGAGEGDVDSARGATGAARCGGVGGGMGSCEL